MDQSQFQLQHGMDVLAADGEKVGGVDGIEREFFVVREGFFFPQDHYIPMTAISSIDEGSVYLNVTKDEALEQEWNNPPPGNTGMMASSNQEAPMPPDESTTTSETEPVPEQPSPMISATPDQESPQNTE